MAISAVAVDYADIFHPGLEASLYGGIYIGGQMSKPLLVSRGMVIRIVALIPMIHSCKAFHVGAKIDGFNTHGFSFWSADGLSRLQKIPFLQYSKAPLFYHRKQKNFKIMFD